MNEFKPFDDKLAGLLAAMSPAGRRRLTVDIAKKLRQRQQQRIKSQKAPDGTAYTPRKRQPLRAKKGRIKREMFAKLRTNRYMKASGNDSAAVVEFTGKVQRIARVHQYGLKDRANPHAREIKYEVRKLIGLNLHDQNMISDMIIQYLEDS